jgi:PKD domain
MLTRERFATFVALACALVLIQAGTAAAASLWLPPQDLSAPPRDAVNIDVELDDTGTAIAVWERLGPPGVHPVQAAVKPPGATFSAPVDLAPAGSDPVVATTPGGEAIVAWWQLKQPPGQLSLRASIRPPGGSFSPAFEIAVLPVGFTGSAPEIETAVNAAGAAVLAWERRDPVPDPDPDEETIVAATRVPGGGFSAPMTISDNAEAARNPDVAIDASGRVIAVWTADNGDRFAAQAASGTVSAGFPPVPAPINLPMDREDARAPQVGSDATGNVTVAWLGQDDGEDDEEEPVPVVPPRVESVSGSIVGAFGPSRVLSDQGEGTFELALAVGSGGDAVAVWTLADSGRRFIQASSKPPGGEFPAPAGAVDLSADDPATLPMVPRVDVNPTGAAVVAWGWGAPRIAQASTRPSGSAAFTAPVGLSVPGLDALFPEVSIAGGGDAVAGWRRDNGTHDVAQAAGFDASPPELRGLSIPASGLVGETLQFSVSPFDVWPIGQAVFNFGDGSAATGNAVPHAYSEAGTYQVGVTISDAAGNVASQSGTVRIKPLGMFSLGKLKRNRKKGIARLTVTVDGPGVVVLRSKGLRKSTARPRSAGKLRLLVKARGGKLRALKRSGKVKLGLRVTFTPRGGDTGVRSRAAKLVKKLADRATGRRG